MNTTIFQETSNLYHILEPIFGRLSKNYSRMFTSEQFHVINYFPFFPFSLFFSRSFSIFMVTSDRVLNQLRICIAYKFNFQRKRNELQHRSLERGVSKYGSLKNEYSRASNTSYTFQLLMSFCPKLIQIFIC